MVLTIASAQCEHSATFLISSYVPLIAEKLQTADPPHESNLMDFLERSEKFVLIGRLAIACTCLWEGGELSVVRNCPTQL